MHSNFPFNDVSQVTQTSEPNSPKLVIAKFGGTSVADFDAMNRCVSIVNNNPDCSVVVTSAPAGITNLLMKLSHESLSIEQKVHAVDEITSKAQAISENLSEYSNVNEKLTALLQQMEALVFNDKMPCSPALRDEVLAFGERIASLLLTACFIKSGVSAVEFDIRQVMRTDDNFSQANPDVSTLSLLCQNRLKPLLFGADVNGIPVVVTQGFIGSTARGETTTLGRGGSDYTAALLSEALLAARCEIWTDVAGVYSTDPRIVSNAYALSELSYDEAAEMANFGAKVLHPATLAPTLRQDIPVFVGSTKAPEKGGTTIVRDCQHEPTFRAITRRREQQLITLHTPKLERASQFIGKVFHILDEQGLSIDLITTSETFISLTLNDYQTSNIARASQRTMAELQKICIVETTPNLDLITVVGNKLHAKQGGAGKIFEVLDGVRVRMICYGANPHNISFLVDADDSTNVIRKLHKHLL